MGVGNPGTYTFKQSESITDGRGQSGNLYI